MADITRWKTHREEDWNWEKRCVSVSELQRSCSPLPGFCYFLFATVLTMRYQPKTLVFNVLGMRLSNQLSFCCVCKQQQQTNPTDPTFKFKSLLILIWREVQFALHRGMLFTLIFRVHFSCWSWTSTSYLYFHLSRERVYLCHTY